MTPRKKRSDSGRMRATTIDEICDRFAALPADGRDGLLLTLQQIDRILRKRDREAALSMDDRRRPSDDEITDTDERDLPPIEEESDLERDRR